MPALKEGMRLLSLADPCVEVRGCTWWFESTDAC
jgi:hypothetical protein